VGVFSCTYNTHTHTHTYIHTHTHTYIYIYTHTCPWPREIELNFDPPNPLSSANLSNAIVGSAPGDKTKISGAVQFEST